jgi:hypothetical protein
MTSTFYLHTHYQSSFKSFSVTLTLLASQSFSASLKKQILYGSATFSSFKFQAFTQFHLAGALIRP